jgi:hypothetical protein
VAIPQTLLASYRLSVKKSLTRVVTQQLIGCNFFKVVRLETVGASHRCWRESPEIFGLDARVIIQ